VIPLIVVLPLLFAFIGFIFRFFEPHKFSKAFFLLGIFSPWPLFILNMGDYPVNTIVGGWSRISGIEIGMTSTNHFLLLIELIVFSFVGVYSILYFDKDSENDIIPGKSIYPLILLLYSGILGCFLTKDLFNFFVYMEIASISSVILVASSNEEGAKAAAFRYLILFFITSFFFLFSIGIIYVKTGTLNFYLIKQNLVMSPEIKVAITMAFVSFITKAGIFPLHFWLPEAHSKADTPVSALLSGLTVKVPIFGMILFLDFTNIEFLTAPLMMIAFSSILFGIIMAIMQKNAKKLLAYSTVSQMGFILLGIATLNAAAAIHYAFAHALFKSGLFLGIGVLISKYGTKNVDELSCKKDSLLTLSIIILTFAIGGISPLIGAFGKSGVLSELSGFSIYLFYIGSIGTLTYFINLNYSLFSLKSLGIKHISVKSLITFILAISTIGFGLYYYPKMNYIDIFLITAALLMFAIFKQLNLFEKGLPSYYTKDIKGLGSEINFYAFVFIVINILILIYGLY